MYVCMKYACKQCLKFDFKTSTFACFRVVGGRNSSVMSGTHMTRYLEVLVPGRDVSVFNSMLLASQSANLHGVYAGTNSSRILEHSQIFSVCRQSAISCYVSAGDIPETYVASLEQEDMIRFPACRPC